MSTALTPATPQSAPTSIAISPVLSKPLESWLLAEPSDERAVETIAKSDILRSEAAMALPALRQAALRPAGHEEIRSIIGSRFATYPQPQRDEGEAAAFWADYYDALEGLTPAQIEAGMAAHVRAPKSEFLPKPGRLADLARSTPTEGRWTRAHNRARQAVERARAVEAPPKSEAPRPTKEEIDALLAPVLEKLTAMDPFAAAKEKAARATPSAPVDERGVSPGMRARLAEMGIAPVHPDPTATPAQGAAA